jgi:hypothetical protein
MSERRVTFTNLDDAHDVGPFGSNAAQLYVKDGKLWAQLQGETVVEVEDLEHSVTYPVGSYTAADITVDTKGRVTAAASGSSTHPTARITSFAADGTWTAPTGVTRAKFTVVGAGGSGCATSSESGGGGGTAIVSAAVTAATGYAITVGTGVSQSNANNGRTGGDSTVVVGATTYTGGGGGAASSNSDGAGGTGTNGDVNFAGAAGAADETLGGGYSFLGPVHGRGSHSSATSSDGIVLVEWME